MIGWVLVLIVFVAIELLTIQLWTLPFIIGVVFALITAYLGVFLLGQIIIFGVVAMLLNVAFHTVIKSWLATKK